MGDTVLSWPQRALELLGRLAKVEPARTRAAVVAVLALAGTLGLALPTDLPDKAVAAVGIVAAVLPLLTGVLIRPAVTPNAKVDALADMALAAQRLEQTEETDVGAGAAGPAGLLDGAAGVPGEVVLV